MQVSDYDLANLQQSANLKLSLQNTKETAFNKSIQTTLNHKSYSYDKIPMNKPLPNWNQSSATLRHYSQKYTFSKDTRFKNPKINYYNHLQLNYPTTLTQRATTFGNGNKIKIPETFLSGNFTATKGCPFYVPTKSQQSLKTPQKGKTFGEGWSKYEKSRTPHRKTVHSSIQVRCSPGPQHYDAINSGRYKSANGKMHQRLKMFTNIKADATINQPGPQSYRLIQNQNTKDHRKTIFGYGQKSDFTKTTNQKVGPIYNIAGFCDKFIQTRKKNIG